MAKDIIHNHVKNALIKDGWAVTHDPFKVTFGRRRVYADLGAEKFLAALKAEQKMVVEVKSFVGRSLMTDLERAIGQYVIYRAWLARTDPEWELYLAISEETFKDVFEDISGIVLLEELELKIIAVSIASEEVTRWIN